MPTGEELLAEGDRVESEVHEKIDEIVRVLDPEGTGPVEDNTPSNSGLRKCGNGESFKFHTRRDLGNVDGWRFPMEEFAWRVEIGEELEELGWTDIRETSFGEDGPPVTLVYASYPGVVREAMISFHPGNRADGVSVTVEGVCHPGDYRELTDLGRERGPVE